MPSSIRAVVIGIFAVAAVALPTASAQAVLRFTINETRVAATATDISLRALTVGGVGTYGCRAAALAATVSGNVISIARGGATFTTCAGTTISQEAAWTATVTTLLNASNEITGVRTVLTIPVDGLKVQELAFGCTFYAGGTRTTLQAVSPAVPLGTLVSIPSLQFSGEELGFAVTTITSRCLMLGIAIGTRLNAIANYALTPALTGTLVDVPEGRED